jgi:hypothetical protein
MAMRMVSLMRTVRFWGSVHPAKAVAAARGQPGLDRLISEDHQRGHRRQSLGERLLSAPLSDPAQPLVAAEFLQVAGSAPGARFRGSWLAYGPDRIG